MFEGKRPPPTSNTAATRLQARVRGRRDRQSVSPRRRDRRNGALARTGHATLQKSKSCGDLPAKPQDYSKHISSSAAWFNAPSDRRAPGPRLDPRTSGSAVSCDAPTFFQGTAVPKKPHGGRHNIWNTPDPTQFQNEKSNMVSMDAPPFFHVAGVAQNKVSAPPDSTPGRWSAVSGAPLQPDGTNSKVSAGSPDWFRVTDVEVQRSRVRINPDAVKAQKRNQSRSPQADRGSLRRNHIHVPKKTKPNRTTTSQIKFNDPDAKIPRRLSVVSGKLLGEDGTDSQVSMDAPAWFMVPQVQLQNREAVAREGPAPPPPQRAPDPTEQRIANLRAELAREKENVLKNLRAEVTSLRVSIHNGEVARQRHDEIARIRGDAYGPVRPAHRKTHSQIVFG